MVRLVLLVILVGDGAAVDRQAIDRAIALELEDRNLAIVSEEERFVLAGGLEEELLRCGSDTPCLAGVLRRVDADLGLLAVLNALARPPLVDLRLIGIDARDVLARDSFALEPGRPITDVARRAGVLFDRTGHPAYGRLTVEVTPEGAEVVVGDGLVPDAPGAWTYTLPPGPYDVLARLEGHRTATATAAVTPRAETNLPLVLEEAPALVDSPYLWLGISAGIVVIGGAVAAAVLISNRSECFCAARPGVVCSGCP